MNFIAPFYKTQASDSRKTFGELFTLKSKDDVQRKFLDSAWECSFELNPFSLALAILDIKTMQIFHLHELLTLKSRGSQTWVKLALIFSDFFPFDYISYVHDE